MVGVGLMFMDGVVIVRRVVEQREIVKNGGVVETRGKGEAEEVSTMEEYDDKVRGRWCCLLM